MFKLYRCTNGILFSAKSKWKPLKHILITPTKPRLPFPRVMMNALPSKPCRSIAFSETWSNLRRLRNISAFFSIESLLKYICLRVYLKLCTCLLFYTYIYFLWSTINKLRIRIDSRLYMIIIVSYPSVSLYLFQIELRVYPYSKLVDS